MVKRLTITDITGAISPIIDLKVKIDSLLDDLDLDSVDMNFISGSHIAVGNSILVIVSREEDADGNVVRKVYIGELLPLSPVFGTTEKMTFNEIYNSPLSTAQTICAWVKTRLSQEDEASQDTYSVF